MNFTMSIVYIVVLAALLCALTIGALIAFHVMVVRIAAAWRARKSSLARMRLPDDWWARFEREFRAYADSASSSRRPPSSQ